MIHKRTKHENRNFRYVPVFVLAIIHMLFVTAYTNDFYPRQSFFFWVTEYFILIHAYFLSRQAHWEWDNFWGINYIRPVFPDFFQSGRKAVGYVRSFLRLFCGSLLLLPPFAIGMSLVHYPLTNLFTALFYLQITTGITLFLVVQRQIWKVQTKRRE